MADDFDKYLDNLKAYLPKIEDETFSWEDVTGLLILKLRNTDSLNKARAASHATQIQLTSESDGTEGKRKTEDFFPTLTLNTSFKSWRISIPTRINVANIQQLNNSDDNSTDKWIDNSIQIRRRILNEDEEGNGNPALQICYGNDLMPLRELLNVDDYIVVVKRKNSQIYEAFGVRSTVDLGNGKQLYVSTKAASDSTAFLLSDLTKNPESQKRLEERRLSTGQNVLLYGVPGCGKSWTIQHEYCNVESKVERLVFHPDYTNADFIGQILPVVDQDKMVTYEFVAGPFTTILKEAYLNPLCEHILVIEEVNRGNAPAIFGEIFQLLDRSVEAKDGFPAGTSEYGVTHARMAEYIYGNASHKVRIPSNLSIIGTMNTSDQNVFTLDTAFQRRWRMRLIENNFDNVRTSLANAQILDTKVSWKKFCTTINNIIIGNRAKMASAEDKRLGVYFVHEKDLVFDNRALPTSEATNLLTEYNALLAAERLQTITPNQVTRLKNIREAMIHNRQFPEKVIKYLWDDAFKFNPEALFDTGDNKMDSLEKVIRTFVYSEGRDRFNIFKDTVRQKLYEAD